MLRVKFVIIKLMNEQPQAPIFTPAPEQPANLGSQPPQPDLQPLMNQPPVQIPERKSKKKHFLLALVALVIIGTAAGAVVLLKSNTKSQGSLPHLTLPNQPRQLNDQFSTQYVATGYVSYSPSKFKTIDLDVPKISNVVPAVTNTTEKEVVFMTALNYSGTSNSKRLIMYDVVSKQTYVVAQEDSVGTYVNPRIMSNHYVVYAAINQTDPLTNNTVIKITDLNTGETKTILSDKGSNLPANFCCAVSPDGLRLVIPQPNKFLIYQAGESAPSVFSATVQVFPSTEGNDGSDYAASQRNYSYPGIVWLDDNSFIYAKAPPKNFKVDSEGTHAFVNNNGLAIYNLTTGTSADIVRTNNIPINWFAVDGSSLVFSGYKSNISGITDSNSGVIIYNIPNYKDANTQALELASQPDYQATIVYSSGGKTVYVQPSALDKYGSLNGGPSKTLQVINVPTGEIGELQISDTDATNAVQGMVGPHQLALDSSTAYSTVFNIYDISNASVTKIFSASKN